MRNLKITNQFTPRESDSLEKYFKEIGSEKLISVEEEAILARNIKQGDAKAMETLVKANLRFVVSVAKQFQNRGLPLADLINEGNIGLIKAIKRFDETRGFKLITYAIWWIRVTIQMAINEQNKQVRLPSNKTALINKVHKTFVKMEQDLHRQPSSAEVGDEICLPEKVIEEIIAMKTSSREVSLETRMNQAENYTLADTLEDTDGENGEEQLINKSFKTAVESALSTLPANQAYVLRLFYGLGDKQPVTLEEIGTQSGFSAEQVRQLKEKAIYNLKHSSRFKYLKEYLR